MEVIQHHEPNLKKNTPSLPRTLAGRRLADHHHVPRSAADLLAFLAGFNVEEAR